MVTREHIKSLTAWFSEYVSEFKNGPADQREGIAIKEKHTHRVAEHARAIAQSLGLNESDVRLAATCGLLHDIGRFEQYATYGTFVDARTENHAALGLRVLDEEDTLELLEEEDADIVRCAIAHHNTRELSDCLSNRKLLFAQILRDADKLDIWKVVTDHYAKMKEGVRSATIEIDLPDTPEFTEKIVRSVREGNLIHYSDIRTLNDFKIAQLAWVYDLNFRESHAVLDREKYLELIRDSLPEHPVAGEIYDKARVHLAKALEES